MKRLQIRRQKLVNKLESKGMDKGTAHTEINEMMYRRELVYHPRKDVLELTVKGVLNFVKRYIRSLF